MMATIPAVAAPARVKDRLLGLLPPDWEVRERESLLGECRLCDQLIIGPPLTLWRLPPVRATWYHEIGHAWQFGGKCKWRFFPIDPMRIMRAEVDAWQFALTIEPSLGERPAARRLMLACLAGYARALSKKGNGDQSIEIDNLFARFCQAIGENTPYRGEAITQSSQLAAFITEGE